MFFFTAFTWKTSIKYPLIKQLNAEKGSPLTTEEVNTESFPIDKAHIKRNVIDRYNDHHI